MKKRILVTTALPYANAPLHFGHFVGVYLPADAYVRFERLRRRDVLFITGSDEYGVAITLSAELEGRTPKAQVDYYHEEHKRLFAKMGISTDFFYRTSDPSHIPFVQAFFQDLIANGYIEARTTEQLYSESEGRFLADRYVVGSCPHCAFEEARGDECSKCGASYEAIDLHSPKSKLSGAQLVRRESVHYFLLFDKFKEPLERFLATRPWRGNVMQFARHYLQEIRPRAITRDLTWGVPVPKPVGGADGVSAAIDVEKKVFYVWFDAPIGYISATAAWAAATGNPEAWKPYWLEHETKYVQFMGKDNIPFHALFFPAMIMGQNQPYKLVDELVASEFYNLEGKKFSKSEGWFIDINDVLERFSLDQIRYALFSTAPETGDSEFTWKEFQNRCNAELVGKFGNLIHRVLVFVQNECAGKIPEAHPLDQIDERFLNTLTRLTQEVEQHYSDYRLRRAAQLIMEIASEGNVYFDAKAPWRDAKVSERRPMMETTLALCLEAIKRLAILSYPLMPTTAEKIWKLLGQSGAIDQQEWHSALTQPLEPHRALPAPSPLFSKIEDEVIEAQQQCLNALKDKREEKRAPQGGLKSQPQREQPMIIPLKAEIAIEDFHKVDLRVGIIRAAEKLPKSKRLLKLRVDLGSEERTILSGISEHFEPQALLGQRVIVVANLRPATLMGVESQGMILAAAQGSALELVAVPTLPPGTEVH